MNIEHLKNHRAQWKYTEPEAAGISWKPVAMINEIVTFTFAICASSLFKCLDKLLSWLIILFLLISNNIFFHSILVSIQVLGIVVVSVQLHINYLESIKCLKCIRVSFLHLRNCLERMFPFSEQGTLQFKDYTKFINEHLPQITSFALRFQEQFTFVFSSLLFSSLLFSHALPLSVRARNENSTKTKNEHSSDFSYVEFEWNVSQNNCYFIHLHIDTSMCKCWIKSIPFCLYNV